MKSICLINIWFGKFCNYFDLWYLSAMKNPTIDFYIITDNDVTEIVKRMGPSENIHFIHMKFDEVKLRFQKLFPFKIKLKTPYKLCDYKPVYCIAFPEIVENYDFWGYCDLDIIMGNIRKFLSDDILTYERVFDAGIFCLYLNTEKMRNLYIKSELSENMAYPYHKVYTNNNSCYFDEYMGMSILAWKYCKVFRDQINEKMILDFSWQKLNFQSYITGKNFFCKWNNGKLYRYFCDENGKILDEPYEQEFMLIHIQKRKMDMKIDTHNLNEYWIVPNSFTYNAPVSNLNTPEERENYSNYIKKRDIKKRLSKLYKYGAIENITYFYQKRNIVKWIRTVKKFF